VHVTAHVDSGQVTPHSRSRLLVRAIRRSPVETTIAAATLRVGLAVRRTLAETVALVDNVPQTIEGAVEWPAVSGEVDVAVDPDPTTARPHFTISRQVIHSWIDHVLGERWEPVTIVPAVTVNPHLAVLIAADAQPRTLRVRVRASIGSAAGTMRVDAPPDIAV